MHIEGEHFSGSKRSPTLAVIGALALTAVCGCATHRSLTFGIYSVPEARLPEIRSLGLDFVIGPKDRPYLDAAAKAGIGVIVRGKGEANAGRHHATIGTYLSDEPDLRGIAPSEMLEEYRKAKKSSSKPVFVNVSSGYSVEAYRDAGDILMFDWYPVGWQPLETFYSNLRAARLGARGKAFYAVIQTFDWAKYPNIMPASAEYRRPTPSEVKAMTLWAAMSDARGIAFYPYDDGHWSLREAPELMGAVRDAIELIRSNGDFFRRDREWLSYPFRFEDRKDQYNIIWDASIAIRASRQKRSPRKWLIVAANTTDREIAVIPQPKVKLKDASARIVFAPLEVKLLDAEIEP